MKQSLILRLYSKISRG